MPHTKAIDDFLLAHPAFTVIDRRDAAHLVQYVHHKSFKSGEVIYHSDSNPNSLYYILNGEVILSDGAELTLTNSLLGEELVIGASQYNGTAKALTDIDVLVIEFSQIKEICDKNSKFERNFAISQYNKTHANKLSYLQPDESENEDSISDVIGWLLTIILPCILYFTLPKFGVAYEVSLYLSAISATLVMWVFQLTHDYVPAIFAMMATLILGIAPPTTALSGFQSNGFIMALSVFSLGAVIMTSGLAYRILLYILYSVPPTPFMHNISTLLLGFLLTPTVPSFTGRAKIAADFSEHFTTVAGYKPNDKASTHLAMSSFTGINLLAPVFLSSTPINFLILGLLPVQLQQQFQWLGWLQAASVYGITVIILYILSSMLFFKSAEKPKIKKSRVSQQLHLLGKLTINEWAAIIGFLFFTIGVSTSNIHKIPTAWIGLIVIFGFLMLGFLNNQEFRSKIDWNTLFFLVGVIGISNTIKYLGSDAWVANQFSHVVVYITEHLWMSLLGLFIGLMIIRSFVPIIITNIVCVSLTVPLAYAGGINPWVVAFITLVIGNFWFMPYQNSFYGVFRENNQNKPYYDEKLFLKYNLLQTALRLIALIISIFYWRQLGFLS
jgi:divalent anion:Na+ symporter, DASS family